MFLMPLMENKDPKKGFQGQSAAKIYQRDWDHVEVVQISCENNETVI